jgi:ribosomal protein L30E
VSKIRDEIIWLAGLLEGEGCFSFLSNLPVIQLNMTDKDVVERAAQIFKVPVYRYDTNKYNNSTVCKDQYRIRISGARAVGIMFSIYSSMGNRRKDKINQVIKLLKESETKHHLSETIVMSIREEYKNLVKSQSLRKDIQESLAIKYYTSKSNIRKIVNNKTWLGGNFGR